MTMANKSKLSEIDRHLQGLNYMDADSAAAEVERRIKTGEIPRGLATFTRTILAGRIRQAQSTERPYRTMCPVV
jgi:hypothetical protein